MFTENSLLIWIVFEKKKPVKAIGVDDK